MPDVSSLRSTPPRLAAFGNRTLSFHPLSADRWVDLEGLFGARGACGGCWCMYWRLPRATYTRGKGEGNRAAFATLVDTGTEPGILAYLDDVPVGWCAVAPRGEFGGLARSRVLKPVDDTPVWSITCLFVTKPCRRSGLSVLLLDAAARFAAARGARVVEGYPVDPPSGTTADAFAWTGLRSAFARAGFTECARRSPGRPIMRRLVADQEREAPRRRRPAASRQVERGRR